VVIPSLDDADRLLRLAERLLHVRTLIADIDEQLADGGSVLDRDELEARRDVYAWELERVLEALGMDADVLEGTEELAVEETSPTVESARRLRQRARLLARVDAVEFERAAAEEAAGDDWLDDERRAAVERRVAVYEAERAELGDWLLVDDAGLH
jgi:hypothetical protein